MSNYARMSVSFGNIGFESNLTNCHLIKAFSFFSAIFSSWLIVLISLERFLCVKFPIKSHLNEGKVLLFVVLIIMSIIIAGLSSVAIKLSFIDSETKFCTLVDMSKTDSLTIAITIGLGCFYSGIPGVLVFVSNVAILHSLRKHVSNRNKCIGKSDTNGSSTQIYDTRSVTVMLLAASFMFVIFRTLFFISYLMLIFSQSSVIVQTFYSVTSIMDWFDHSANLLVYCASSSVFRSHVKGAMCCRKN